MLLAAHRVAPLGEPGWVARVRAVAGVVREGRVVGLARGQPEVGAHRDAAGEAHEPDDEGDRLLGA